MQRRQGNCRRNGNIVDQSRRKVMGLGGQVVSKLLFADDTCYGLTLGSLLVMVRIIAFANATIRMFFYYLHSHVRILKTNICIRIREY